MNELKPCPMCGGAPNKPAKNGGSDERSGYNFTITVACKCGLRIDRASHQGKQGWCDDSGQAEAEAIAAWNRRAQPAAPAAAAPSVAPTAELWMYDFTDDGKPVKDWTTSSREEAFAPGHFNQRRYGPEQPAVPQDRTRSKDDLWRAHSTGPSPHWNVVLSAAAFHKARAVAGTQSTAEDAALYRGIQAYMHHSMPPDAAPSVAPEPLFLLHSGQIDSGGEQDDWETEADSQVRVDEFCRLHPGQTIPLFAHPPRAPLTDEHVTAVVRSVCPNLAETSKAWRDLVVECRYWLEAAHGIGGK